MRISILIGLLLAHVLSYAQIQVKESELSNQIEIKPPKNYEIRGQIISKSTKEPLAFVTLILEQDGKTITGGQTDFDGFYLIKLPNPGTYTLKTKYYASIYSSSEYIIQLNGKTSKTVNFELSHNPDTPKIVACGYTLKTINHNDKIVDLFEEEKLNSDSLDTLLPGYQLIHNPVKSSITIYPNPSSGLVNITNPLITQALTLYDLSGKIVYQMDKPSLTTVSIDISTFQNGVYILRLKDEDGVQIHRIIKN